MRGRHPTPIPPFYSPSYSFFNAPRKKRFGICFLQPLVAARFSREMCLVCFVSAWICTNWCFRNHCFHLNFLEFKIYLFGSWWKMSILNENYGLFERWGEKHKIGKFSLGEIWNFHFQKWKHLLIFWFFTEVFVIFSDENAWNSSRSILKQKFLKRVSRTWKVHLLSFKSPPLLIFSKTQMTTVFKTFYIWKWK